MANLPSNTFLCNYNALQFDTNTNTIPQTTGQIYNKNLVLTGSFITHIDQGYITIQNSPCGELWDNVADNPFNRYNEDGKRSFTAVYKCSLATDAYGGNLVGNRGGGYNWMLRKEVFHTLDPNFLGFEPSESPYIAYVRIQPDGTSERKCITTDQIATASSITWGAACRGLAFFAGQNNGGQYGVGEEFSGDFYWLYISNEALTDAEIAKVIAYNESTSSFNADPDSLSFGYEASSSTITLEAEEEMSWTATSVPSWITLSNTAGTGTATITVSAAKNNTISPRTATIVFSNGEDTAEVQCTQAKHPLLVPFNNIYRNGLLN